MFSIRPLSLVFLLLPLAVPAQEAPVRIHDISDNSNGTLIQGSWPTACQPAVQAQARAPSGRMDILLGDSADHCALGAHPFSIQLSDREQFSPVMPHDQVTPIRVYAARDTSNPALVGFALRGGQTSDQTPDSGFWWPQDEDAGSGNVLSLELQGDTLGIALLTHDDLSGAPVWFFGTSKLHGQTAHASLTRLDDGSSPFFGMSVRPIPHPGWTIDLAFDSSTHARIWLNRPSPVNNGQLELSSMQFARRSFSTKAPKQQWHGTWLIARDAPAGSDRKDNSWPARLDLSSNQTLDTQHTRLIDRNGDFALDCRHSAGAAGSAQSCTLRNASGQTMARFDHVGLNRLDGQDNLGHTVVLLRPR